MAHAAELPIGHDLGILVRRPAVNVRIALCLLLVALYATYDAFSPRFLPFQKITFAVLVCLVLALSLVSRRVALTRGIALWCVFLTVNTISAAAYGESLNYVLGDLVILVGPLAFLLFFRGTPESFSKRVYLRITGLLFGVALIAPFFRLETERGRFEPPSVLLIALLWAYYHVTTRHRLATTAALATTLLLSYFSTVRAILLQWGLVGVVLGVRRRRIVLATLAIPVLYITGFTGLRSGLDNLLLDTRFKSVYAIFEQGSLAGDTSLYFRALEVQDAWETFWVEGNAFTVAMGFGHGAAYTPSRVYDLMNDKFETRNISDGGRVHNIHFGPMRALFRYGFVGLALYIALWAVVLRDLVFVLTRPRDSAGLVWMCAFTGAMAGYLVLSLLYTISSSLVFSFAAGGYFACHRWRREMSRVPARGSVA